MRDVEMHEEVIIKKTGKRAFIIWFNEDEPSEDSYLLELKYKDETPLWYERKDFEKITTQ